MILSPGAIKHRPQSEPRRRLELIRRTLVVTRGGGVRNPAVRRVDNQRRAPARVPGRAAVEPQVVVEAGRAVCPPVYAAAGRRRLGGAFRKPDVARNGSDARLPASVNGRWKPKGLTRLATPFSSSGSPPGTGCATGAATCAPRCRRRTRLCRGCSRGRCQPSAVPQRAARCGWAGGTRCRGWCCTSTR